MRVLGAVVQIPALLVFDAGKQMALRDAVASQLVATINPRHILQSLQQSSEETLGSVGPIFDTCPVHKSAKPLIQLSVANESTKYVVPRQGYVSN